MVNNHKKILVLVMSCTLPYYRQKEVSIKETWAKPILEGKYPNVDLWFFNSGTKDCCDEKTHRIFVKADDRRDRTFQKLCKTLLCVNSHPEIFGEYDYIIRINISSVPNIPLFMELCNHIQEDELWTSTSFNQHWVANHAPFFSGECFVLSKFMISLILNFYIQNKKYFDNLESLPESSNILCCDDGWLTTVFYNCFKDSYPDHLKTYGIVYEPFLDLRYQDKYADHLLVTFKTDDCGNTYHVDKHPQHEEIDRGKREVISKLIEESKPRENWWEYFTENILDKECRPAMYRTEETFCTKQSLIDNWNKWKQENGK